MPEIPGTHATYIAASLRNLSTATGDAGDHEIVTYDAAAVDDDGDAAVAAVREALTAIGDPDWAPHIDPLPFAARLREHRASCADARRFAQTMPAAWVRQLAIAGTPGQAREAIGSRHAAGATSVVLAPAGREALACLDSLARALPPRPLNR
ncbi:hypothetical protein ACFY4C_12290 [Actinomadura viridis]|uniref:hypothetical protein n=1 Tax=Actinomadura viridis TaxID=58110 RepID=UPI0036CC4DED